MSVVPCDTPEQEAEFDRLYAEAAAAAGPVPPAPSGLAPNGGPSSPNRVDEPSRSSSTGFDLLGSDGGLLLGPDDLRGDRLRALDDHPQVRATLARLGVANVHEYATLVSGRPRRRSGPELAVWKLDVVRVAGLIEPVPVDLPELPASATETARMLRDRFAVLLGLRRLRGDGEDAAPFTKRFAADWCGVSESSALRALGELRRAEVIVKVGTHPSRHGRSPASVYLPGEITL